MRREKIYGAFLFLTFALTLLIKPGAAVDTLTPNDFKLQSFSKTVDFFDFARAYAAASGKPIPPSNWHAYLYQNYINSSGFQLFYSGLINITAGQGALTIPVQSFLEHYKTPNGKDVLTSSSFIMLLAFNDTATSLHADSPDINDNLYASFSLGFDPTNITGTSKPALNSKTELIPLTGFWVTFGQEFVYYLWFFRKGGKANPLWWIIPVMGTMIQGACFLLDKIHHPEQFTCEYLVVARKLKKLNK